MRFWRALFVLVLSLAGCGMLGGSGGWTGGIHAVLRHRTSEGLLLVERVTPNGAAARAGLQPGDRIVTIEGTPVTELSREEVVQRLRGEVGTRVRLRIAHEGAERDVVVERSPYQR